MYKYDPKKIKEENKARKKDANKVLWNNKEAELIDIECNKEWKLWKLRKRIKKEGPIFGFSDFAFDDMHIVSTGYSGSVSSSGNVTLHENKEFRVNKITLYQIHVIEDEELKKLTQKWLNLFGNLKWRFFPTVLLIIIWIVGICLLLEPTTMFASPTVLGLGLILTILWLIKFIKDIIRKSIVKKAKRRWKQISD